MPYTKTVVDKNSGAAVLDLAAAGMATETSPAPGKPARRSGVKEPSTGSAGAVTKGRRSRR